jgi:hypothetical protein
MRVVSLLILGLDSLSAGEIIPSGRETCLTRRLNQKELGGSNLAVAQLFEGS